MLNKKNNISIFIFILSFFILVPNTSSAVDLVNVSTRGKVGTGQEIMVVGFIVEGSGNKQFFLSAAGPTLTKFGVDGVLEDPKFTLFRDGIEILQCDNWKDCPGSELVETYLGLSGLTLENSEAAMITDLAAGSYTLEISGMNSGTGIALGTAIEPVVPGNITTVEQIKSGQVPSGSIVVMVGKAISQLDGDDYIFEDHTGQINVEWEGSPPLPLNKLIEIEGKAETNEVEINSFRQLE